MAVDKDEVTLWWKQQLSQLVLVNLPVDFVAQESLSSTEYGSWRTIVNEKLTSKLTEHISRLQLDPIVFFDAVCRVLFYRYSQQADITWLVTGKGPTFKSQSNDSSSSLVSRLNLDPQANFTDLCQNVQTYYNQLFASNAKLLTRSVESIAKSLEPKSLNVLLIGHLKNHQLNHSNPESKRENENFDLIVQFDGPQGSTCSIDYKYNVHLFKETTIHRLSIHLLNLMHSLLIGNPNGKLDDHELLDERERKLIEEFNPLYPRSLNSEMFFIQMFDKSVSANAHLVAVKEENRFITYQQLNQSSNQLAAYLTSKCGVVRGQMVAIMLPQGIDNFISLLAVLKLGCSFVPLGIDYPADRIKYILKDCDEPPLITQEKLLTQASVVYRRSIYMAEIEPELETFEAANPPFTGSLDDLAYCMYTSGSTGQPKGVLITQRTISYMAISLTDIFTVDRKTRSSLISNTAFDAAICESFPTLVQGGLLVLPDLERRYDHHYLVDWLIREKINYCYLPAKILDLIFETNLHLSFKHPIKIWASGEPLGAVKLSSSSHIEIFNVLGMTELTPLTFIKVNSLTHPYDHVKPPVGSPVPGVKVYITDPKGRTSPIGVVGEIHYSSTYIAKGYHKLAKQTSEKFLVDPFNGQLVEGSRLLRSGDLARWRADGLIDFIGRADDQVKVRGYRVELTEIEKLLNDFPGIHQSVVLIKKGNCSRNDPRIVAFVMLVDTNDGTNHNDKAAQQSLSTSWRKHFGLSLHSHLRSHLPYFMLPQVFVVPSFPLNSNGKVDKPCLLTLDDCEPLMSSMFHQPVTKMHHDMVNVWSSHLNIPRESLGIDDNFFELGGHSLVAVSIVGQLNQSPFDYPITTRMILTLGTIRSICDLLEQDVNQFAVSRIPKIESHSGIDLCVSQAWLALYEYGSKGAGATNEFSSYSVPETITWKQVNQVINYLIERHEALRITTTSLKYNRVKQSALPFVPITIEVAHCSTPEEAMIEIKKCVASIDNVLNRPKALSSFGFIELPTRRLVIFATNHLVADGMSFQLIGDEMRKLFDCLKRKSNLSLTPLTISYLDYVVWENQVFYKDESLMIKGEQFWAKRLKGYEIPRLPMQVDPLLCIGDEFETVYLYFDDEVTSRIDLILREYRTTLFIFTQAMILSLLNLYTQSTDLTIYTVSRNINHHMALPLVGNLAVVNFSRVSWPSNEPMTFINLLRLTHRSVMVEHEFRFYPFHRLYNNIGNILKCNPSSELDPQEAEKLNKLIPITITQGPDLEDETDFIEGVHTNSKAMNALVVHFMRIQKRYTIELIISRKGFDPLVMKGFSESIKTFVRTVTEDPTKRLIDYVGNLSDPHMVKWRG